MESSIIAALISAGASIIVALIGRAASRTDKNVRRSVSFKYAGGRTWVISIAVLAVWIFASEAAVYGAGAVNWFLIAVVTVVLSVIAPIRPLYAAAVVLMLFAENFLMADIHWMLRGIHQPRAPDYFTVLRGALIAGFASALVVGVLCKWRARPVLLPEDSSDQSRADTTSKPRLVGDELSKLAELHATGALTDEEFHKAKARILGM